MSGTPRSKLLRPKLVALDSSHLGAVAADKATNDRTRLRRVEAFEKAFDESASVLLICRHHLQELFSHGREDIVAQRVTIDDEAELARVDRGVGRGITIRSGERRSGTSGSVLGSASLSTERVGRNHISEPEPFDQRLANMPCDAGDEDAHQTWP
jgi:hypothetical protein